VAPGLEIQGHRGARGLAPENTIAGIRTALALGVDAVEVDVALTADGIPVLSHDPALNPDLTRGPDGNWLQATGPLIATLRHADLAGYDVGRIRPGSAYAARYPEQVPVEGAAIPTLAEALAVHPALRVNIELKLFPPHPEWTLGAEAMADAVVAVVDRADAAGRVSIQSFDWRAPRRVRSRRPDIAVGWLTEPETVAAAADWWGGPLPASFQGSVPRAVRAEGGGHWAPAHPSLTRADIAEAHALGLRVLPWTVNDPSDMRRLVEDGADGLITDRPDLARRVLADLKLLPALPRLPHHVG